MNQTQPETQSSVQKHHDALEKTHRSSHRMGTTTILLLFGLFGLWSIFANIATTITANGKIITNTYNKTVMHPKGGIVRKLYVQEGNPVEKDQKLLELDSTEYQANLDSSISLYDSNLFNICRLEALALFSDTLDCSPSSKEAIDKNNIEQHTLEMQTMFDSDRHSLQAKITLLKQKNEILLTQDRGLKLHIASNKKLLNSYQNELKKWKKLLKQQVVDELKAIDIERKILQVEREISSLHSNIEENLKTIESNKQQIILEREEFRNRTLAELSKRKLDNSQLRETIVSLRSTVEKSTIRSPSIGQVTDMKIRSDGEVVSPNKPIMEIVPNTKELMIEAYVLPADIEKVAIGQKVEVHFASFVDPSALPVEGEITYISADSIIPEEARDQLYRILVKITSKGLETIKINEFHLLPGMPVSAFIKTGESTLMKYLMQPFIQLSKGIFNAN